MSKPHRDPMLPRIVAQTADAPSTVTDTHTGLTVPLDAAAVAQLRERLLAVAQMHTDGELSDAQLLAVVPQLADACVSTSAVRHLLKPEQIEAARQRAIDELAGQLSPSDVAQLNAL